jgi:hypothetical protein
MYISIAGVLAIALSLDMAARIIDFHDISRFFLNWTSLHINEQWGALFIAIGVLIRNGP